MKLEELFSKILNLPLSAINDEISQTNTKGWDSLAQVNIVTALEENFDVTFSIREIREMKSVADARRYLRAKGADL